MISVIRNIEKELRLTALEATGAMVELVCSCWCNEMIVESIGAGIMLGCLPLLLARLTYEAAITSFDDI